MSLVSPLLAVVRALGRAVLQAVRIGLLLLVVIIPIPVTFSWMKRIIGDRRNIPSETLRKD